MIKKIILIAIIVSVAIVAMLAIPNDEENVELSTEENVIEIQHDIYMPVKSSRPGCEETDACYIPPTFTVKVNQTVTWMNQDVAFHSVTSGTYEEPTDLFDSGHLDPDELFTLTFDEQGEYDFFCTLHPWMKGKVIVEN